MIAHIDKAWRQAKRSEMGYPFRPKDMANLRHFSGCYQEWGIMALWDVYITTANEWVVKNGYPLDGFFGGLPRLVDDRGWKMRSELYRRDLEEPIDKDILELFDGFKLNASK